MNGESITTTPTHPFYVPQKGWTEAIQLRAGDILVTCNGEYVVVEQVQHELLETPITVYNFEVEDFHTYYVAADANAEFVLVHNKCKGNKPNSAGNMDQQVRRGQAPKGVDAVHKGHVNGQEPHVHFKDGTSLTVTGKIHDKLGGIPKITNPIAKWLGKNGWATKISEE